MRAALLACALAAAVPAALAAQDTIPLKVGDLAPDFTLTAATASGVTGPVRLSDFRGRAVLLSFISCYADTCFEPVNAFEALVPGWKNTLPGSSPKL